TDTPTITPSPTATSLYPSTGTSYVYPQPVSDSAYLVYSSPRVQTVHIHIYAFSGELVASLEDDAQAVDNNRVAFSVQAFAPGVYFYVVRGEGSLYQRGKVLVVR